MISIADNYIIMYLHMENEAARLALMTLVAVWFFCLLLRIIIWVNYRFQRFALRLAAKEIKQKSDIRPTKNPLLNKVIKDFKDLGERGISHINSRAIAERHVLSLNILGAGLPGLSALVFGTEHGLPVTGFILAVIYGNPEIFGGFAIGALIVTKFLAAVFDISTAREVLVYNLSYYVDKEVGQYYAGDLPSAVQRLKVELVESAASQSACLSKSIEDLGYGLDASIKKSMEQVAENVSLSMESLLSVGDVLDKPVAQWREAVESAAAIQTGINLAVKRLQDTAKELATGAEELKEALSSCESYLQGHGDKITEQLLSLEKFSCNISEKYDIIENIVNSVLGQGEYLKKNQETLNSAIEDYRESLNMITAQIGTALGSIVSHHIEQSYYNLNDELKNSIRAISLSNSQVIQCIEKAAQQTTEYNQSQLNALMLIKDEIQKQK